MQRTDVNCLKKGFMSINGHYDDSPSSPTLPTAPSFMPTISNGSQTTAIKPGTATTPTLPTINGKENDVITSSSSSSMIPDTHHTNSSTPNNNDYPYKKSPFSTTTSASSSSSPSEPFVAKPMVISIADPQKHTDGAQGTFITYLVTTVVCIRK